MRSRFFVIAVLLSLAAEQGCAASRPDDATSVPIKCSDLVRDYVKKTRGWDAGSYVVEEEEFGGPVLGFSVWLLEEDKAAAPPGGGKSFHVDVDQSCSKVLNELAYQ